MDYKVDECLSLSFINTLACVLDNCYFFQQQHLFELVCDCVKSCVDYFGQVSGIIHLSNYYYSLCAVVVKCALSIISKFSTTEPYYNMLYYNVISVITQSGTFIPYLVQAQNITLSQYDRILWLLLLPKDSNFITILQHSWRSITSCSAYCL